LVSSLIAIFPNDSGPSCPEISAHADSPWVIEQTDTQSAFIQLGHHLKVKTRLTVSDITSATV